MRHGLQNWRPGVQNLKTNDALDSIDSYVDGLARGERLQVAPLFLDGPRLINGGMDSLGRDRLKHGGNSAGIRRGGSPYCQ